MILFATIFDKSIEVCDSPRLKVWTKKAIKVVTPVSVFEYTRQSHNRFDVRWFVMGMRFYEQRFYVCDRQTHYLVASGG